LLQAWGRGDEAALNQLLPLVHQELRRLAARHMRRERPDHTLQASALVNEAYLRLIEVRRVEWQNRGHFFAMASRVMRRILVDASRAKDARKRQAGDEQVPFDDALALATAPGVNYDALDDALTALEANDERKCRVVEMRFFGGMSEEETALALRCSLGTIKRDWRLAKAWLARELGPS
jgi:RNA polymerase sigma factor (TIGR02999 family)